MKWDNKIFRKIANLYIKPPPQVHPKHKLFAVAEKGDAPNIIIYSYPELRKINVLRGGTEKEYAYIDFKLEREDYGRCILTRNTEDYT